MKTVGFFGETLGFFQTASQAFTSVKACEQKSGPHVLIFPGYCAIPQFYRGMQNGLNELGFRAHLVDIGINIHSLERSLLLLGNEARRLCKGEPFSIVGHSLGGAMGVAMLALTEWKKDIGTVITLGTPFLGCAWKPLRYLVLTTTGISEETFKKHKSAFMDVSEKIVSIASPGDRIAPPEKCFVPESEMRSVVLPGSYKIAHMRLPDHPLVHRKIARAINRIKNLRP